MKSAPKPAAKPAPAKPVPAKTVAVAAAQPASKPAPAAAPAASKAPQSKNPVPVSKSPAKTAVKSDSAPKTVSRPVGKVAVAVAARSAAPAPRSKYKVVEYKTDEATGRPILPAGYKPSSEEEYMSPLQQEYFRQRLQNWRADLVEESKQTIENLREEVRDIGDEAERATRETENSLELRTRDRYRKLIGKIDSTLKRLEAGDYGYCVDTGEESAWSAWKRASPPNAPSTPRSVGSTCRSSRATDSRSLYGHAENPALAGFFVGGSLVSDRGWHGQLWPLTWVRLVASRAPQGNRGRRGAAV